MENIPNCFSHYGESGHARCLQTCDHRLRSECWRAKYLTVMIKLEDTLGFVGTMAATERT